MSQTPGQTLASTNGPTSPQEFGSFNENPRPELSPKPIDKRPLIAGARCWDSFFSGRYFNWNLAVQQPGERRSSARYLNNLYWYRGFCTHPAVNRTGGSGNISGS